MGSYFDENTPDIVLKSLFSKYDKDNSGFLQKEEIGQLLECDLGLETEKADLYSLILDQDGSISISYDEFKAWINSGEKLESVKDNSKFYAVNQAVNMFKQYDTDKQGTLNTQEFQKLMYGLNYSPDVIEDAINAIDKDGNNEISFYEFLKWLNWVALNF